MNTAKNTINENKSLHWDKAEEELKTLMPRQRLPGFPFNEGFPTMYGGQRYEIILVNGDKHTAMVDASREFASEGLEWKSGGKNYEESVVAAWKKLP